jgi:hypothetical protein
MKMNHSRSWAWVLAFLTALTVDLSAASVTATLDTGRASVGQPAQLTVTVTGSQDQPSIPSVPGLDITPVGQSTQVEIINGSMTANVCDTYQVTPQHDGTFVIPAIRAGNAASKPITLHVGKGSMTAASPGQPLSPDANQGNQNLPPPSVASSNDATAPATTGQFGSLQVTLPKKNFYVGELIPIDIKAYIPAELRATVTDLPQMAGDAFAMNPLSNKPDQERETINGHEYNVMIWHSALTAVKPGEFPLNLTMPETVIVPQQAPRSNDDDDIFGDLFRNAFASMSGVKKDVQLKSDTDVLKVQSLPLADRPADFGGAVGEFEVDASAAPTTVAAGDPMTLRLRVSGTGNFDRVNSDMLPSDSRWKTYSPKTHFDAADSVGYQGAKTIEQPIIPNDSSVKAVPSLSFSFFNPELGKYVTRTTPPLAVTVSGAPASSPAPVSLATGATMASNPTPALVLASDLIPNKIESDSFVSTLRPVYLNPWFLAGQCIPILALIGGLMFIRRQKIASSPHRTRATAVQQAIREQLEAMDNAMQNQETDAFFIHARSALQQRLGQEWNLPPETITLADIETRLGDEGGNIRPIFEMADQASYSDLRFENSDLREWRQIVINELQPSEKN